MKNKIIILLLLFSCSKEDLCDCVEIQFGRVSNISANPQEWNIVREFKDDCSRNEEWTRDEHNSIKGQIICK